MTVPHESAEAKRYRLQAGLLARMLGKKVSVATADFHHLVGIFKEIRTDGRLGFVVGGREVSLDRGRLVRIHEADRALAEYIK